MKEKDIKTLHSSELSARVPHRPLTSLALRLLPPPPAWMNLGILAALVPTDPFLLPEDSLCVPYGPTLLRVGPLPRSCFSAVFAALPSPRQGEGFTGASLPGSELRCVSGQFGRRCGPAQRWSLHHCRAHGPVGETTVILKATTAGDGGQ